jgi:hypothetical protein
MILKKCKYCGREIKVEESRKGTRDWNKHINKCANWKGRFRTYIFPKKQKVKK